VGLLFHIQRREDYTRLVFNVTPEDGKMAEDLSLEQREDLYEAVLEVIHEQAGV
jgi:hypothetical protein